jgi:hypothetical protein
MTGVGIIWVQMTGPDARNLITLSGSCQDIATMMDAI